LSVFIPAGRRGISRVAGASSIRSRAAITSQTAGGSTRGSSTRRFPRTARCTRVDRSNATGSSNRCEIDVGCRQLPRGDLYRRTQVRSLLAVHVTTRTTLGQMIPEPHIAHVRSTAQPGWTCATATKFVVWRMQQRDSACGTIGTQIADITSEMGQSETRPPSQNGEPENCRGHCPGLRRRRSPRAHASTTVLSALPLRLVTVMDGNGQPQVRLMVDRPDAADPAIELQKRAI
jgi:hypothetical protein